MFDDSSEHILMYFFRDYEKVCICFLWHAMGINLKIIVESHNKYWVDDMFINIQWKLKSLNQWKGKNFS